MIKAAALQMTSTADINANMDVLKAMVSEAVNNGATLIATPENTDLLALNAPEKIAILDSYGQQNPLVACAAELARTHKIWLLLGSVAAYATAQKVCNRSYLFSPDGDIICQYDKIHLFDVVLPSGEVRRESDMVQGGRDVVHAQTAIAHMGLSICYDVRFAALYRKMAQAGAQILSIPAAFTVFTGQLHWEVLLRARAIENGAFVIAPAQCGHHGGDRHTYGHAMIIDPWGKILAQAGDTPTIIYADLDLDEVSKARAAIPALSASPLDKI